MQKKLKYFKTPFFTLVELVLVISILAILISLLQTSLTKVLNKTSELRCLNNLKNLGNAEMLYSEDYNSQWVVSHGSGNSPHYGVMGLLMTDVYTSYNDRGFALGYIKDSDVLYCPNVSRVFSNTPSRFTATYGSISGDFESKTSFRSKPVVTSKSPDTEGSTIYALPTALSQNPARMSVFLDTFYAYGTSDANPDYRAMRTSQGTNVSFRHSDRSPVLFLDGHASAKDLLDYLEGDVLMQNMTRSYFLDDAALNRVYWNNVYNRGILSDGKTIIKWNIDRTKTMRPQ